MTPAFRIVADGADVTAVIQDRLLELTVQDLAGGEADTATLGIDDRANRVALPAHQAKLEISLGTRQTGLVAMGAFLVDRTELSGPPSTLRIQASAADMSGAIRAPRTTAWEGQTLGDIARAIAARAGLKPVVAAELDAIAVPYLAQTSESDLHLLTRLGAQHHFTFAPKAGHLILAAKGGDTLPTGDAMPVTTLALTELTEWSVTLADRAAYKSVEAQWSDLAAGQTRKVTVGSGTPSFALRRVFPSAAEARQAATAKLQSAAQAVTQAKVTLGRFGGELFAGGRVQLAGLRPELAGPYTIKRAEHRLADTLTTSLDLDAAL